MKKLNIYFLSISFILIFSSFSNAQLNKGNLMVGGLISTSIGNGGSQFGLYPSCAYFFKNNLALGGALDLTVTRADKENSSFIALSALGRYYFAKIEEGKTSPKLPVFVQGKLGVSSGAGVVFASGGLGFDYFLTSSVALEASAGVNIDNSSFANVYAMLGFQIFLPSSVYKKSTTR